MKIANLRVSLMICMGLWMPFGVELEPAWAQKTRTQPQWNQVNNNSADLTRDEPFEAAIAQMKQGELPAALMAFEQMLVQRREAGDRPGEATALMKIGQLLAWQGKYEQSVDQLQAASQLWNELEQPAQQAETLAWLGNSYRLQEKPEQAEATLQKAIALSQSAQNSLGEAEALWFLGATFAQQDWSKAAKTIAQALSLVQGEQATPEQRQLEGRILSWAALATAQQESSEKALVDLQKALAIQQEVGDRLMQQVTLGILGGMYRQQGELEASLGAYQEGLAIAQVMQVPAVIGRMQNQVGIAHYRLEQYPEALSAFEQAAKTYEALEKREALAQIWSNIGDIYYQQNELEAMQTAYEQAASIYESVGKINVLMNYLANQSIRELSSIDTKAEGQAFVQAQEKIKKILTRTNYLLELSRDIDSTYHQVRYLYFLETLHSVKNDLEMSNERFQAALDIALKRQEIIGKALDLIKAVGDFSDNQDEVNKIRNQLYRSSAVTSVSIYSAYSGLGKLQEALQHIKEARVKAEEISNEEWISQFRDFEASAYLSLGGWYKGRSDYQLAIDTYEKVLEIVPKDNDSYLIALLALGGINETRGHYDGAKDDYWKVNQISSQAKNDDFMSISLRAIASVYTSQGEYRKVIELLEAEIKRRKSLGKKRDDLLLNGLLNNLAVAYSEVGEASQAQALHGEVLEYHQTQYQRYLKDFETGSWDFFCENQPEYRNCQQADQEFSPAQRRHLVGMGEIQLGVHRFLLATSLSNMGVIQQEQGKYREALEAYQVALLLIQGEKDKAQRAKILGKQASIYQDQAQYQLAYEAIQKALSIAEAEQDVLAQLQYSRELAQIYAEQGQFSKALEIYNENLQTARTIGLRPEEAGVLYLIGNVQSLQGDYAEALASYEHALALREDMGDRRQVTAILNAIGGLYRTLGQVDQSLDLHKQVLEMGQQLNNKHLIVASLQFLGSAYRDAEEPDEALRYLQQALDLNREIGNRFRETFILEAMAKLFLEQQQADQAIAALEKSLVLSQQMEIRPAQARALGLLGEAYAQQQKPEQALDALQRSLAIAQDVENQPTEALALSRLGDLYAEESPEMAIALYKQSVNTYETIRGGLTRLDPDTQQSYTDTIADTYRRLADLLLQQDRILEAQQVLDLLKVQELEDYLQNTRSSDSGDLIILKPEQEILDRYQDLQNTAIEIGKELTQLRQLDQQNALTAQQTDRLDQLIALETDINQQFNNFLDRPAIQKLIAQLARTTDSQNLSLKDLSGLSDNLGNLNAALIYPLILPDRLELILATPDSPPIRRTVTQANDDFDPTELNRLITQYRQVLNSPNDLEGTHKLAQQLYNWILKPLEDDLATLKPDTLIYAPDGALRYIPLAALYDGEQWIAQRYATNNIVASSVTDFDSRPKDNPKVLAGAFGDDDRTITLGEQSFPFRGIPFTLSEVQALERILPTQTLAEQTFDRKTLLRRLNSFNIVHLATHGQFLPQQAANSFIALGSGEALPLKEIANLRMNNVDLVVLSACETGVGGILGEGEEILGLGYQFQRAGAKTSLASLWQVDDGGTEALMSAFYAALQNGMTKAQALQEAQKAMISGNYTAVGLKRASIAVVSTKTGESIDDAQLSHPYYWAPFILIGNGL